MSKKILLLRVKGEQILATWKQQQFANFKIMTSSEIEIRHLGNPYHLFPSVFLILCISK